MKRHMIKRVSHWLAVGCAFAIPVWFTLNLATRGLEAAAAAAVLFAAWFWIFQAVSYATRP